MVSPGGDRCGGGWSIIHTWLVSQAFESAWAKGLCAENVSNLYYNLEFFYSLHEYPPSWIWNCNESNAQAGQNDGAIVIAKSGAKDVHSIVTNSGDWLSVLVYINVAGLNISSSYIFRGVCLD